VESRAGVKEPIKGGLIALHGGERLQDDLDAMVLTHGLDTFPAMVSLTACAAIYLPSFPAARGHSGVCPRSARAQAIPCWHVHAEAASQASGVMLRTIWSKIAAHCSRAAGGSSARAT
jgi:hypothetical protein